MYKDEISFSSKMINANIVGSPAYQKCTHVKLRWLFRAGFDRELITKYGLARLHKAVVELLYYDSTVHLKFGMFALVNFINIWYMK